MTGARRIAAAAIALAAMACGDLAPSALAPTAGDWLPFRGRVEREGGRLYLVAGPGRRIEISPADVREAAGSVLVRRGAAAGAPRSAETSSAPPPPPPPPTAGADHERHLPLPVPNAAPQAPLPFGVSPAPECGGALGPHGDCAGCGICYGALHYCCKSGQIVGFCPTWAALWSGADCPPAASPAAVPLSSSPGSAPAGSP